MPTFDEECGISIELKSRLGWTEPDRYPGTVLVQHDCCYDYGVNYYPKLTCSNIHEQPTDCTFWPCPRFKCSLCGKKHVSMDYVYYCPNCGAKVVD